MRLTLADTLARCPDAMESVRLAGFTPATVRRAVDWALAQRYTVDLARGTTYRRGRWDSAFHDYTWGAHYETHPEHIFLDFFAGTIRNKCYRIDAGLDP